MKDEYIEHYVAVLFHRWFMKVSKEAGDSPFRAVVQNLLYSQDPDHPQYLRIQSFIHALNQFIGQLRDRPDPDPPPTVFRIGVSEEAQQEMKKFKPFSETTELTLVSEDPVALKVK